jgi:MerR family copper efflux transcriptional regulator
MNISKAAELSELPAKTIRYYEEIDLVVPDRRANGYRDYSKADIHRLAFLHRARNLGFDIESCRKLLALYSDTTRESATVKALASAHLAEIEAKMVELREMADTLRHLIDRCHGDDRPDCPIIERLAGR